MVASRPVAVRVQVPVPESNDPDHVTVPPSYVVVLGGRRFGSDGLLALLSRTARALFSPASASAPAPCVARERLAACMFTTV